MKRTLKEVMEARARQKKQNVLGEEFLDLMKKEEENLAHEIKKLITSIIKCCTRLTDTEDYRKIGQIAKDIDALANLALCRMTLYEYRLNPLSQQGMKSRGISIYQAIEKIYKSVQSGWANKNKRFIIEGESRLRFFTHSIISVGLYIILENAWKYSMESKPVKIAFREEGNVLEVEITNWGPVVMAYEKEKIKTRGYRGEEAKKSGIKGDGLGLSNACAIFTLCNVKYDFPDSSDIVEVNGVKYTPFTVKLTFLPMVQPSYVPLESSM